MLLLPGRLLQDGGGGRQGFIKTLLYFIIPEEGGYQERERVSDISLPRVSN